MKTVVTMLLSLVLAGSAMAADPKQVPPSSSVAKPKIKSSNISVATPPKVTHITLIQVSNSSVVGTSNGANLIANVVTDGQYKVEVTYENVNNFTSGAAKGKLTIVGGEYNHGQNTYEFSQVFPEQALPMLAAHASKTVTWTFSTAVNGQYQVTGLVLQ